jgi:hypothetical protein
MQQIFKGGNYMDNYEQLQKEMARILEKMSKIQDPRGDDYRELANRLTTLEGVRKTMEETSAKTKEAETKAKEVEIKQSEVSIKSINESELKLREMAAKEAELTIMRRKNIGDWVLKGTGIAAQVGLVLLGFCFESEESLSGFFSKAVMPKVNFFGEKK